MHNIVCSVYQQFFHAHRLQKHYHGTMNAPNRADAVLTLLAEMDTILVAADAALGDASAKCLTAISVTSTSASNNEDGEERLVSVKETATPALHRTYTSLQDACSGFFTLLPEASCIAGTTPEGKLLLNSEALWAQLKLQGPKGAIQSSWSLRVAAIRDKFMSLSDADSKLATAMDQTETLRRENSSLVVEIRAAKSKLADSMSVQAVKAVQSVNDSELQAIKKENEVCVCFIYA